MRRGRGRPRGLVPGDCSTVDLDYLIRTQASGMVPGEKYRRNREMPMSPHGIQVLAEEEQGEDLWVGR